MFLENMLDLLEVHTQLEECFLQHQESILHLKWAAAVHLLERFRADFEWHVRQEEEILLPIYVKKVGAPRGGTSELFVAEHRRMMEFVDRFLEQERALAARHSKDPREAIRLIDEQASFKNLVQHHDRRERTFLYKLLEANTTPEEKQELLERLRAMTGGTAAQSTTML